jgi:hypothetical protein
LQKKRNLNVKSSCLHAKADNEFEKKNDFKMMKKKTQNKKLDDDFN